MHIFAHRLAPIVAVLLFATVALPSAVMATVGVGPVVSDPTHVETAQSWSMPGTFLADGSFELAAVGIEPGPGFARPFTLRHGAGPATSFAAPSPIAAASTGALQQGIAFASNERGQAVAAWNAGQRVEAAVRDASGAWGPVLDPFATREGATHNDVCDDKPLVTIDAAGRALVFAGCTTRAADPDRDFDLPLPVGVWVAAHEPGTGWEAPVVLAPHQDRQEALWDVEVGPDGSVWVLSASKVDSMAHRYVPRVHRLAPGASAWNAPELASAAGAVADSDQQGDLAISGDGSAAVVWSISEAGEYDVVVAHRDAAHVAGAAWPASHVLTGADSEFNAHAHVAGDSGDRFWITWSAGPGYGDQHARIASYDDGMATQPAPVGTGWVSAEVEVAVTALDAVLVAMVSEEDELALHVLEPDSPTWSPGRILNAPGDVPVNIGIDTDLQGNAAITWMENGTDTPRVTPWEATGPLPTGISTPLRATVGAEVALSVAPTDVWSAVTGISWEIGARTASGASLTHTFTSVGPHVVLLTLTDSAGNSNVVVRTIDVTAGTPAGDPGGTPPKVDPNPKVDTTPTPEPPKYELTDTTSHDKMPALVGLSVSQARDHVDRAGIQGDFELTFVNRNTPPRGIRHGDVMVQQPVANTVVTSAIRDAEPVRLQVYAGPASLEGKQAGCTTARVSAAVTGMELDLARLVLREMKCPYRLDVRTAGAADPTVRGVTTSKGKATVAVTVPKAPARNDLFVIVREMKLGMSLDSVDWALTAGERNAITIQVVDRGFRFQAGAKITIDGASVGSYENLNGTTNGQGERPLTLLPTKAGTLDILVETTAGDGESIYGVATLTVKDRSKVKVGTILSTTAGRDFRKDTSGRWVRHAAPATKSRARFVDFGKMFQWMGELVKSLTPQVQVSFSKTDEPKQALSAALGAHGIAPGQLALGSSLISGNVRIAVLEPGQVVAAGGGNVVAAGGGNVVAPGGGNVVAAGGGNVVAAGGGNVVAAGGGNMVFASGPGVVAAGGGNVVAAGGGNVVAAGGGNVVAAGGGNLIVIH